MCIFPKHGRPTDRAHLMGYLGDGEGVSHSFGPTCCTTAPGSLYPLTLTHPLSNSHGSSISWSSLLLSVHFKILIFFSSILSLSIALVPFLESVTLIIQFFLKQASLESPHYLTDKPNPTGPFQTPPCPTSPHTISSPPAPRTKERGRDPSMTGRGGQIFAASLSDSWAECGVHIQGLSQDERKPRILCSQRLAPFSKAGLGVPCVLPQQGLLSRARENAPGHPYFNFSCLP